MFAFVIAAGDVGKRGLGMVMIPNRPERRMASIQGSRLVGQKSMTRPGPAPRVRLVLIHSDHRAHP